MNLEELHDKCDNCPYPSSCVCVGRNIEKCTVSKKELKKQIEQVLDRLYENDFYLIDNEVNEVCIVAHFWRYFFEMFGDKYINLNMDIEYNRNGKWAKYYGMSEEEQKVYAKPDMIIHKRGCNKHNFLCIEFKGYWNRQEKGNEHDEEKLIAFTKQKTLFKGDGRKYSYRYGYGIKLKMERDKVEFNWYENGEYVNEDIWLLNSKTNLNE